LKENIKNKKLKFLDMGSGSGYQAQTIINLGVSQKNITLVDINPKALKHLKLIFPKSRVIKSNLFSNIKEKYDIIFFNSPYLPEDKREPKSSRLATTGGRYGGELLNKFLKRAKSFLKKGGKVYIVVSSLTKNINFEGYDKKIMDKKKIFFEELLVYELKDGKNTKI
ncbi:MAG: methyltransferase, partial [Nanoarchaeota archaeon]|nr:methyltransferase [Nanoarchaeota archaeon]